VDLILDTVNSTMAPEADRLTVDDVEMTTVGVRPLIRTGTEDESGGTYSASRRHELYHHTDHGVANVWSIGGGKWTTGRATAEQMVDRLFENELSGLRSRRFDSRRTAAFGAFAWAEDADPFLQAAADELVSLGLTTRSAETVARLYGSEYSRIADIVRADADLARAVGADAHDVGAQVVFAVTHESALTLSDVIDRRLVVGTTGQVSRTTLENVARIAAPLWGWDDRRIVDEVRREHDRRTVTTTHWRTPTA
jgi:glycerol-3-phosphate dehydrogenase